MSEESDITPDSASAVNLDEEKTREVKYMVVVVALLILLFLLYNILSAYADYSKATASDSWPKTPVTKADPNIWRTAPSGHDATGHWNYYIYYQYTVDGHYYCRWTPTIEGADEQSIKLASEQEVTSLMHGGLVSYNPADPDQSTVRRSTGNGGAPLSVICFYAVFLPLPFWLLWCSGRIMHKAETTPEPEF